MQALRARLALLLLLCLGRTLLLGAWLLALHPHAHTTEEPAPAPTLRHQGKALISAQHQHCAVAQFYDVDYQAGAPVALPAPRVAPRYARALPLLTERAVAGELFFARRLRGPPLRA